MIEIPAWMYGALVITLSWLCRELYKENKRLKHITEVQDRILKDYWNEPAEKHKASKNSPTTPK